MSSVPPAESLLDTLWEPLVAHGAGWCAGNIHADVGWLEVGRDRWRVAVTRPIARNCYVVSATGQYLDYATEEIRRLPSAMLRGLSHASLLPLAPMLRRLDPIVVLDALPVSTVLHASRSPSQWAAAVDRAREAFPGVPIVVRSLDERACPEALECLPDAGMTLLPSRLVFHQDPRASAFWTIRNVRHDVQLAREKPLESRPLVVEDSHEIAALYWQLYGEKHSELNPRFTAAWLAHGIASGVLRGAGLMHDGRLAAAYLSYTVEDVMTNPVFGYDTMLPQQLGLYRRLSVLTMQDARARGVRIHASSGAPGFKASRGGEATIEYHAVDLRGVRGAQRVAWETTLRVSNAIAPRMLRSAR